MRATAPVLALLLAGCGASGTLPTPTAFPSGQNVFALPSSEFAGGTCAGTGLLNAKVAGDPTDPRIVWLDFKDFPDRNIIFPPGYTAWFTPNLEVHDAAGVVVLHGGDAIEGTCGQFGDRLLLVPPFR